MSCYYFGNSKLDADNPALLDEAALSAFVLSEEFSHKYRISDSETAEYSVEPIVFDSHDIVVSDLKTGWRLSVREDNKYPVSLLVSADYSDMKVQISDLSQKQKEHIMQLLRTAVECGFTVNKKIALHASAVAVNGKAILFVAPSGMGKSTQAALWCEFLGAELISGDRPCVSVSQDVPRVYGVPWDGKEACYNQNSFEISAIIEVRQSPYNYCEELKKEQALRLIMKQAFIPMWDEKACEKGIMTLSKLSDSVKFYKLGCLPDKSAVRFLYDIIFNKKTNLLSKAENEMKIKDGFVLRNVVGEYMIMPTGSNVKNFEGTVVLNETSAFIWNQMKESVSREETLSCILKEFAVDRETAEKDLDILIDKLSNLGLLCEES